MLNESSWSQKTMYNLKCKALGSADWPLVTKSRLEFAYLGLPHGSDGKESICNTGDLGSIPGLGRSPGGRECLPTPIFLPGESHQQRNLVGYSP